MAVPKKKKSKSARDMRRSHHALKSVKVKENETSGELHRPHRQGHDFLFGDQFGQLVAEIPVESCREFGDVGDQSTGYGLPGPPPQHRPQLVLRVKTDSVINAVHRAVDAFERVTTFAVGIVDEDVQNGHSLQPWIVRMDQGDWFTLRVEGL